MTESANLGQPRTGQDIKDAAWILGENNGNTSFGSEGPSNGWLHGFFSRHSGIMKRTTEFLSSAGANVTKKKNDNWFDEILRYIEEEGLTGIWSDSRRILNADESGFRLHPGRSYAYVQRGTKDVFEVSKDSKATMSVMFTIGADGHIYRPFIIYPGIKLSKTIKNSIPSDIDHT